MAIRWAQDSYRTTESSPHWASIVLGWFWLLVTCFCLLLVLCIPTLYVFLLFNFLLKYSWFILWYHILLYNKVTQSDPKYIYTFFFSYHSPLISIVRDWTQLPMLYCRITLPIYSKCNSLHQLTPNSQSIPLPLPLPLATTSLFSMSESVSPP